MVNRLANFINMAMTELVEANETLSRMAVTDLMTKLYNRGEIQRRITERVQEKSAEPTGEDVTSVVMIDLDNFKRVNDTYGHQEGDLVLTSVAALIREAAEKQGGGAAGGRWGGEEFMILLPGLDKAAAAVFADKVRAEIEKLSFPKCGCETASFGVAQALPDESADHLTSRADAALYAAKNAGKNRVCMAEE